MPINKMLQEFIKLESKSAMLLLSAVFLAMVICNSPWGGLYQQWINNHLSFRFSQFQVNISIQLFVNEVLMTIFFFMIGLEMKREILVGEMSSQRKAILPLIASISGMLMAGLIYLMINGSTSPTAQGWAIPTATDIALSSSVLGLLGRSVPPALRLFLTMLAIIDDVIAAAIIVIFYSHDFHILFLLLSVLCLLMLFLLNRMRTAKYFLYVIWGTLLWFCMLEADISPAVSGVLIGFAIPMHARLSGKHGVSLVQQLEKSLHPWVSFLILPLFVFVNAGFSLTHFNVAMFFQPLTLGVICGLLLGKQLGIFSSCWFAVKAKIAYLPRGISWRQLYGMSILCGMGFTMNLFISFQAFPHREDYLNLVKLGILTAAVLSAILGYSILRGSKCSPGKNCSLDG